MVKLSLRERRRKALINQIARMQAQREAACRTIARVETTLPKLERQLRRYERAPAITPTAPSVEPLTDHDLLLAGGVTMESKSPPADGLPDFLRRTPNEQREQAGLPPIGPGPDAVTTQFAAEIAERKKAKARGQAATRKAKQSGATKRMPLQGKAALAAIRG